MDTPACAVGRMGPDGPWLGFAPTLDDGYALVVGGTPAGNRSSPATRDDLVALALAYFEESLDEPPEELAATHGDIGGIVRHAADRADDGPQRRAFTEAVDAIDDGLAADVVMERLATALGAVGDPIGHLRRRATELVGG
jgi:hypothetical protein